MVIIYLVNRFVTFHNKVWRPKNHNIMNHTCSLRPTGQTQVKVLLQNVWIQVKKQNWYFISFVSKALKPDPYRHANALQNVDESVNLPHFIQLIFFRREDLKDTTASPIRDNPKYILLRTLIRLLDARRWEPRKTNRDAKRQHKKETLETVKLLSKLAGSLAMKASMSDCSTRKKVWEQETLLWIIDKK